MKEDKELQEFRNLVEPPETYHEGFGWGTVVMALFVGLLMTPAQMYMQLVAGIEMGPAAQWVTVILYVEVARRAFKQLNRPEIFVLFYMCGAVVHAGLGGFGGGLLWQQFIVQSEEMRKLGITDHIPEWFAPSDPAVLAQRSFLVRAWLVPVGLSLLTLALSRLNHFGLGYVLFRLTSDVEQLPFPMAPVNAMGTTALADASSRKDTWRWRTFSIGAMAGAVFGAIYLALPNITSALFGEGLNILPIPFVDLTEYTDTALPAFAVMISFDLTFVVIGMVLPFWAMAGAFIGVLITMVANPVLYHVGLLDNWERGIGGIKTIQSNTMDFYFSFGLGLALAVAAIGIWHVVAKLRRSKTGGDDAPQVDWSRLWRPDKARGDFSIWVGIGIYVVSTLIYIAVSYVLVNHAAPTVPGHEFPLWILVFFGFVYTPFINYVSTRMEGIVGRQVQVPFIREAMFILSGYKGAAIWFAPIPLHNYAQQAQFFRTTELTGTRFTGLIKAELLIFPIMIVGRILFSQFIWSIDSVPSELFPYANKFWELRAFNHGLMYSATLPGEEFSPFHEAFRPEFLTLGFVLAVGTYIFLSRFGLPVFLVYGVIRGLDQSAPHAIVPMFIGALIGRYVMRKRFGDRWPKVRVVFAAGFTAGVGLATMFSLGIVFMSKSVIKLPV